MAHHLSNVNVLLFFVPISISTALYIDICDCSNPSTKGLIDLSDPKYCFEDKPYEITLESVPSQYQILKKINTGLEWKGYACSQWTRIMKITGSFWVTAFDTTFHTITKIVEPQECWNMIQTGKCNGNPMIKSGDTMSFTQEPNGVGQWNAIKEFWVLQCYVKEITLRQESANDQIFTSFGYVNTTTSHEHFVMNLNTIVWHPPKNITNLNCGIEKIFQSEGKRGKLDSTTNRLLDREKQLEIL